MLNKAILMGRLTADPELRHTTSNTAVTSFTLAVNRRFSQNNETDFIDIVAWSSTAEFVSKYFKKGMQVAVAGRIQTRTWKDKDGNNRRSTEVVADEVHFADSKRTDASDAAPRTAAPAADALPSYENEFKDVSEDEDELPF